MEMSKDKYAELVRRFSQELYEVGVTENMKEVASAQAERTPNIASCGCEETVSKFSYQYDGYKIEATCTISLTIKKCKK